jgi:hypothetical protein
MHMQRLISALAPLLSLPLVGVAQAGELNVPNVFTPNTPARADEVNANFDAVDVAVDDNDSRIEANRTRSLTNTADIRANRVETVRNADDIASLASSVLLFRNVDTTGAGNSVTGDVVLNSISVDLPSSGLVTIAGTIFINNQAADRIRVDIIPLVDGTNAILPVTRVLRKEYPPDGSVGEQDSMSFSVTVPISAGPHTIAMEVTPNDDSASWFYNSHNLTALFVATSPVSAALAAQASSVAPEETDASVDDVGEPW